MSSVLNLTRLAIAAQTIKDNISALDVGEAIGLEIRHGRCKCPIHNGNDFNCVLYKGNRGYYCHVCKAGGDVIHFTQQYYGMSFKDAVSWLNSTFNLGMDISSPMTPEEAKRAEKVANSRKEMRERADWKDKTMFGLALGVSRIVDYLEEQRDRNEPGPDDPWSPEFCAAIKMLPSATRLAQDCMFDCVEVKV